MGAFLYHVHADWDPEAGVWVATSDDVPGLATEAATLEALTEKLRTLVPRLAGGEPTKASAVEGA